jgi:hypothetical protein
MQIIKIKIRKNEISVVSKTFLKHDPAGIKTCRKTTNVID